jgi:preprotein translocase SecF subunit
MILAGVVCIFVRGHNVLGVDFAGGDSVTMTSSRKLEVQEVRTVLEKAGLRDVFIQYQGDFSAQQEYLNVKCEVDSGAKVIPELAKAFPDAEFTEVAVDRVQPVVGKEILINAGWAVFWALVGILIYVAVRFEFPFAVGAVIAIIHDVLMTVGWYVLTGRQFSATFVAAILTIIGYSINDTVVIFDRVREQLVRLRRESFGNVMNLSINQMLSRSIITNMTVFFTTLSLLFFGGPVLRDFALAMTIGAIAGSYSTIFVAGALVLDLRRGREAKVKAA